MKRVLQVLGTTNLGGAESRVMDIYRHLDRDRLQFDFLITEGHNGHFDEEIRKLGGNIYFLPAYRVVNRGEYVKAVKDFFAKHRDYIAVHGHMTSTASIYLPIAKEAGIPLTIAHARSAGTDSGIKGILTKRMRKNLYKKCDRMMACSELAAAAVFGSERYEAGEVTVWPNAISVKDFAFDENIREEIRQQYGIGDEELLVGHVGRFHEAKNHLFIIDVFKELVALEPESRLMFLGDGALRPQVEEKVAALGLSDKVIFAGNHSPISPYYQAFDMFLFPSIFEGMPGTVVEAQAAGLPCLISDAITPQVCATNLVNQESLNKDAAFWAGELVEMYEKRGERSRGNELLGTDYDVHTQVEKYYEIYGA